jgi:hypothetical protein
MGCNQIMHRIRTRAYRQFRDDVLDTLHFLSLPSEPVCKRRKSKNGVRALLESFLSSIPKKKSASEFFVSSHGLVLVQVCQIRTIVVEGSVVVRDEGLSDRLEGCLSHLDLFKQHACEKWDHGTVHTAASSI